MSKNKNILPVIFIGMVLVFPGLSSCQVLNRYQRPEIDTSDLYRDSHAGDTTTIADIPWREFFTDTHLIGLIEEGLKHNADLQVAVTGIRQAEANLNMARASYFPTVSLTGQVSNMTTSDANKRLGYNSNNVTLGIAASWELDLWGRLNRQARSKHALFLQSHSYRNLIQSSLIANIATSYFSLLALDEQLQITTETVALLEKNVETMMALKEAGMQNVNEAAVEQSRALMLRTKLSIYDLESAIRQMENAISVMLGRKPGAIERSAFETQTIPGKLQTGVPAQLLARRPDVIQAELDLRSAFELTNAAQASFYPSVTLNAGSMIGFAASGFTNFFSSENLLANVIGGLTQPIFNRGQLKGNLKIAKAQQEAALITFKNTLLRAGQEVSDILFSYQSSAKKNSVRQEQIVSTRKAVEYTKDLLIAGEANYTEVLTAEQNYLSAQLSEVSDKLEQLQYSVNLYRALGGGAE
ncbi:efflux transporter outer membrane subunit [Proteiniphilum sp. X52]|uniref:efflux transporter outer membrane subunit n=1 Tax=Proteiniphilum sp. X52 TaxID=2382159 RepID=UPI000F0A7522|nr:efflux transporter outer membrane subunit [Proteiniphilum sp. X52]RNC63996.1 efflux transporter outer membrane subunit [Proteiniphilum sp. X52]